MKITLDDAKAFLIGAGAGSAIKQLRDDEIFSIVIKRLKEVGINAEITDKYEAE